MHQDADQAQAQSTSVKGQTIVITGALSLEDLVLTWEEYKGLVADLLAPECPAAGETRLSEWLATNREQIGVRYASEVARHYPGIPKAAGH